MHKNYPVGTKVQHRNRYIFVKCDGEKKWKAEHRWVMEQKVLGRDLEEGERVYHRDGDRENNQPANLVAIKFATTKYVFLKKSRVLYIPKEGAARKIALAA